MKLYRNENKEGIYIIYIYNIYIYKYIYLYVYTYHLQGYIQKLRHRNALDIYKEIHVYVKIAIHIHSLICIYIQLLVDTTKNIKTLIKKKYMLKEK
jgi:hypothetical protein